jgi:hypothetical protein
MWFPTLLCAVAIVSGVVGVAVLVSDGDEALAETRAERTSTEIKLGGGRKLVDVSWRCFGDYPCRPFLVTRVMRKDETAESYELFSPYEDAGDAYIIKETR